MMLPIVLFLVAGAMAVYLLLPRPQPYSRLWGAIAAAVALLIAARFLLHPVLARSETVLFYAFSGIAIVAGLSLITQRNPAYAALSFAIVVLSSCGLFLLQAAAFLMAATIIIYAGAIIVTFLFVLMLAHTEGPDDANDRSREPLLATIAGFFLLGAILYVLTATYDPQYPQSLTHDVQRLDDYLARAKQAQAVQPAFPPAAAPSTVAAGAAGGGMGPFNALGPLLAGKHAMTQEVARATGEPQLIKKLDDLLAHAPDASKHLAFRDTLLSEILPDWSEGEAHGGPEGVAEMKRALARLEQEGAPVRAAVWARAGGLHPRPGVRLSEFSGPSPSSNTFRDSNGNGPLPAENVAALGRSLFTDYLLAVELAGTLLLVATIGAIAIATRHGEKL